VLLTHQFVEHEQQELQQALEGCDLMESETLLKLYHQGWDKIFAHGDIKRWSSGFEALPNQPATVTYGKTVKVVTQGIDESAQSNLEEKEIEQALRVMLPWRKGPFEVFNVHIDTEWRSDFKWQRVVPHISSLKRRKVLDIGCGSGYHLWRMLEEGAALALGIDTSPLFAFHFATIKRYAPHAQAFYLPTGIDEMPDDMHGFDTVFSMGILYHRKNPLAHLMRIKSLLNAGGEIVLETLVVDGDVHTCLMPTGRYAKMRNVWFIPSVAMLTLWLQRVGFKDVRCVDINQTTTDEQRVTDWMRFESLSDYLDPDDSNKTIEGYPAPKRAVMVAHT